MENYQKLSNFWLIAEFRKIAKNDFDKKIVKITDFLAKQNAEKAWKMPILPKNANFAGKSPLAPPFVIFLLLKL